MFDLKTIKLKAFAPIRTLEYMTADLIKQTFPLSTDSGSYDTGIFDQSGSAYKLGDFQLPIILMIGGEGFSSATDVILNGQKLAFSVKSDSLIYAQLPPRNGTGLQRTESLYVLVDRRDFSISSLMSFELGSSFETVAGPAKLVMQFIKVLLTTPGSDDFDKNLGGGLNKFPGQNVASPHQLLAMVTMTIMGVEEQIKTRQQTDATIPPNEKLSSVNIVQMDFAKGDPTSIELRLRIVTQSGHSLPTTMTLGAQGLSEEQLGGVSEALGSISSSIGY